MYRNPGSDTRFATRVTAALRHADGPADLQSALRAAYPLIAVRASAVSGPDVWYVYRDGAWVDDGP